MGLGKHKEKKDETKVFVRQATGLVKHVSLLDAISLNLGDMSAGAAVATIGFSTILLSSMAGINLVYASLLAFILSIPQIIVYTIMNRKVHRTGGGLYMDLEGFRRHVRWLAGLHGLFA